MAIGFRFEMKSLNHEHKAEVVNWERLIYF
jgi:hypothetical protein